MNHTCDATVNVRVSHLTLQEIELLKDALYPSLMCKAARDGNIRNLEKLRAAVSPDVCCIHLYMYMYNTTCTILHECVCAKCRLTFRTGGTHIHVLHTSL